MKAELEEVANTCFANRIRKINRVISKIYDEALKPYGLQISHSNLLVFIATQGKVTPYALGKHLQLEKSSVSRLLNKFADKGWVQFDHTETGRIREVELTEEGAACLQASFEGWESAQAKIQALFNESDLQGLMNLADSLDQKIFQNPKSPSKGP